MKVGVSQVTRDGVNHISTGSQHGHYPAPDDPTDYINAIDSIQTCSVCRMGGHTLDYCSHIDQRSKRLGLYQIPPRRCQEDSQVPEHFLSLQESPLWAHVRNIMDNQPAEEDPTIAQHDDNPSLQMNADGYIHHLHDWSATAQEDDEYASEKLSIHSDPFGGLMVQFVDVDRNFDHTLEDMILCNVHTDDDGDKERRHIGNTNTS
jgi:hypothetical protein